MENRKSSFTCITCHVVFKDLEFQREHYKSDWHRYNIKRKVAEFPPISAEQFQERVLAQRCKNNQQQQQSMNCKVCRKVFNTINQYKNHLDSKKHKENSIRHNRDNSDNEVSDTQELNSYASIQNKNRVTICTKSSIEDEIETDSEVESVDSDEWIEDTENPVENNNCLFCSHHSRSLTRNLKHMTVAHSFFIPDPEFCIDLKGLLKYLGEKIFAGYVCIWCNDAGKKFQTADAVRAHMTDKGHCKILHEGETLMEYSEFYDYSSSYPDAEDGDADTEVEIPALDDNDYQLVLPSGNVIGHRCLMRYYKQSLNPNAVIPVSKSEKLRRVLLQYRALGWTGTQKEAVTKKVRDIKYMQKVQAKYSTQLQFKANKLQRYFRQQVNF